MYNKNVNGETVSEMMRGLSQNGGCGSHIAIYIFMEEAKNGR